jgi:hypothetical protein
MILIKIKTTGELSIKELSIDPPDRYLRSLIQNNNILQFSTEDHIILGVINLTILYHNATFAS